MTSQHSLCRRSVVMLSVAAMLWLAYETFGRQSKADSDGSTPQLLLRNNNHCLDPDDPPEWRELDLKKNCQCPDPTRPSQRDKVRDKAWYARHELLIRDVEFSAVVVTKQNGYDLDLVMLGDSITERWNRTKRGDDPLTFPYDEDYRSVYNQYFDKIQSSKTNTPTALLQALALGTSGDITTELLWHLQNGMLPDSLRPKVFMLLIGTNDLGRSGCSKRTVLAGILQVAHYLYKQRPGTPIVLHGLLPRNDVYVAAEFQTDYTLGRYWSDIVWINAELAKFGKLHHEWLSYLDANHVFLVNQTNVDGSGATTTSTLSINPDLMRDALHPSAAGCQVWAPLIVDHVLNIIQHTKQNDTKP